MTDHIDDGGPVHPVSVRKDENYMDEAGYPRARTITMLEGGITLRDEFAKAAMIAVILDPERSRFDFDQVAEAAYQHADAMLVERRRNRE
ncbi:hypothetical protein [Thiocapsa sp. N5-Cardenillas]|uniref:hypothetical protein n=1 Tax=Thiocapsa sp. N5-Cardenillas TaxID=3137397 RepID=UPI0035AFBC54